MRSVLTISRVCHSLCLALIFVLTKPCCSCPICQRKPSRACPLLDCNSKGNHFKDDPSDIFAQLHFSRLPKPSQTIFVMLLISLMKICSEHQLIVQSRITNLIFHFDMILNYLQSSTTISIIRIY